MQVSPTVVREFHVSLEHTPDGHQKAHIVFADPDGAIVTATLPAPFGCAVGMFFLGCLKMIDRIERVPSTLRHMISHIDAIEMLIKTAFGADSGAEIDEHLH